ncbi:primosomal protein N' [Nocardia puris]|uniref:Probable replication restart protein PriA n=1 Tax=Nocardia puris TaxID=208602 RepID=A0A366E1E5_9NOCA|nr:primosomal protein N' [Nocardia puris]RBO96200.1 primosomal protein N' (replication factor Y) [Nocardia puris]
MASSETTTGERPVARVLPLLTPAHLDRDFDYLVPPALDEIAQPGVRVRVRFSGRLVDGYLLARLERSDHSGKLAELDRVVSAERVLTPEVLDLVTAVAARYAGTRADVLRLAIPPRHARTENGGKKGGETSTAAGGSDSAAGDGDPAVLADNRVERVEPLGVDVTGGGSFDASGGQVPEFESATPGGGESSGGAIEAETGTPPSGSRTAPAGSPSSTGRDQAVAVGDPESADGGIGRGASDGQVDASRRSDQAAGDETESGGSEAEASEPRRSASGSADDVNDEGAGDSSSGGEAGSSGETDLPFDPAPWERYVHGSAFLSALRQGKGVRAAWQALPGEDWARRLAELAATVVAAGRSAILMVPDQRDLDRVLAECTRLVGDSAVGLAAGLGPAARYRRWLAVLRGTARVVVGTRSAVFAPAHDLGLLVLWDDGDDTYAEPRAPYPHAREVAMLRAHETGAAFVAAGFARTAEIQAVVDSGWAHDLVADRAVLRAAAPRISAPGDSDHALARDPVARAVRIPGVAFEAARAALKEGASVLVQVPRRGYVPALACAKCRTPARCRRCNGPLALPVERPGDNEAHSPSCRWCGITEPAFRCATCGSRALRAVVIGAARTAEELGRAFPGVPIRGSGGGGVLDSVEPGPQVVVATVGAEPIVRGGYGVALLLDGWALLGRADLRASEDALRRWMAAAALVRAHGRVIVMAEPSLPTVQALVRWDPIGHARAEVEARAEVGFPPAVRMAAVDGASDAITELLAAAKLPDTAQVLGPVPLPPGARKPFAGDSPAEVERMILRVPRRDGLALARSLTAAQAVRSTHRTDAPLRVQIDPVDIG